MLKLSVSRIAKAKIKDGQVFIDLEGMEKDTEQSTALRGTAGFHPDLQAAFDACAVHIRTILEWPAEQYAGALVVTGINWKYGAGATAEGAIFVCNAKLASSQRAFCFNTPYLPFAAAEEQGQPALMPEGAVAAQAALLAELSLFLKGKRAQGDMFGQGTAAPAEDTQEPQQRVVPIGTKRATKKALAEADA